MSEVFNKGSRRRDRVTFGSLGLDGKTPVKRSMS